MEIFHMPRWTPQSAQNKEKTSARKKKKLKKFGHYNQVCT